MRAMVRRTSRTRAVLVSCEVAFWNLKLNCSRFNLMSSSSSWSSVKFRMSSIVMTAPLFLCRRNIAQAGHYAGADRKLRSPKPQGLARGILTNTIDLKHDLAWLDAGRPEFRRALSFTHADFSRLLRYRKIREYPDPNAARALHLTCDRAPSSLDLPRSHALRLQSLKAETAKVKRCAAFGVAIHPALEGLPEFCLLWLQHRLHLFP